MREFLSAIKDNLCAFLVVSVVVIAALGAVFGRRQ